jgi:ATP-dependent RNA helicase DDX24/MAK5
MSKLGKRKRNVPEAHVARKQKQNSENDRRVTESRVVRGDSLKWKTVSLPDRLDDAEGFYELEEIDDVDVVRDERNHVMFRPKSEAIVAAETAVDDTGADKEWTGFDDEEAVAAAEPEWSNRRDAQLTAKQQAALAPKSILKPKKPELEDVSFETLDDSRIQGGADVNAWGGIGISQDILSAISNLGYAKPTSIQEQAIPPILEGEDVIGKAVTGSGKTLSFGIPIMEMWMQSEKDLKVPTALVLAPTRELASQLHQHLSALAEGLPQAPRIVRVTGGLSILKQQRQLETADIIIATPGRMWEVMSTADNLVKRLKAVKFLVVDEADRLLSEGHFKEVEDILDSLDRQVVEEDDNLLSQEKHDRQILVFSATFHKDLHKKLAGRLKSNNTSELLSNQQSLAYLIQKLPFRGKPVFIDSNPDSQMAEHLNESIIESPAMEKDLHLYSTLLQNPKLKTLVFTNSISSVKRVTAVLQSLSVAALALHSTMPQKSRLRALERFAASSQQQNVLIATDVAARGLDIKNIDLIIHYHVPRTADMYVHRSGRTARAEASGRSILLCSPEEVVPVTRLIAKVHSTGKTPPVTDVDKEIIKRIRRRVELAQKIVETEQAKEKVNSKDDWLKKAADELGVDYDSEEFEEEGRRHRRGRGGGKTKALKEKAEKGKEAVAKWKAELKELLSKRVNMGVSERYLAGGKVDVDAILDGRNDEVFLASR